MKEVGSIMQTEKESKAYALAVRYLLSQEGVNENMLNRHISFGARHKPETLAEVYETLLVSAQSPQAMPNIIGKAIPGGLRGLTKVLHGFEPAAVAETYPNDYGGWSLLLHDIREQVRPSGKVRGDPRSLWLRFCGAAISGAVFLSQFRDMGDFRMWINRFEEDARSRLALPLLIDLEVHGVGFALACDFLKEVGCEGYCKPDVHLKDIFTALGLSSSRTDYEVFRTATRIAQSAGVSVFAVDQVFWLVGSGDLRLDGQRLRTSKTEFISMALAELSK